MGLCFRSFAIRHGSKRVVLKSGADSVVRCAVFIGKEDSINQSNAVQSGARLNIQPRTQLPGIGGHSFPMLLRTS